MFEYVGENSSMFGYIHKEYQGGLNRILNLKCEVTFRT